MFCNCRENQNLHKTIEKLESDLIMLKEKNEDLKISKQEAIRELMQLKDTHNDMVSHMKIDLLNETSFREEVDRRLADVRAQVCIKLSTYLYVFLYFIGIHILCYSWNDFKWRMQPSGVNERGWRPKNCRWREKIRN